MDATFVAAEHPRPPIGQRKLSEHPAIATVLDAGTTGDGRAYLLMTYLSGGSLQDAIDAGPGPVIVMFVPAQDVGRYTIRPLMGPGS